MVNLALFRKHVKEKSLAFVPLFTDQSRYQVPWGGAGCVHPETKIHTEFGLMRICDINRPMRVLSWNQKDQKFQLSLSGGSFPKGRDYLYRVVTPHGEFQSSGHHLVLLSSGAYQRVDKLQIGDEISQAQPCQSQTIAEHCQLLSLEGDQRLSQTDVSYLAHYASECRRYDPLPHEVGDYALFSEQQPSDAQELGHSYSTLLNELRGKARKHSRLCLSFGRKCRSRFFQVAQRLASFAANYNEASSFECTSHSRQGFQLSAKMCALRHIAALFSKIAQGLSCFLADSSSNTPSDNDCILSGPTPIKSIELMPFSEYWCMQVCDTNNYISEDGTIHHNSGKSHIVARKLLYRLLKEDDVQHKFLIVRKVNRTLKRSVFTLFKNLISKWNLSSEFAINNTDLTITYKMNGSQLMFTGMDDPEKLKSIEGITGIWMEEATEFSQEDFEQLDLRLRGVTKYVKQIILTFNPISEQHWIKKVFFDDPIQGVFTLKTTYLDNAFIDDEYKMVMENKKKSNPRYYNIYALGNWGTAEGLVFSNVTQRLIRESEIQGLPCLQGLDFGYTNDPSALSQSYIDEPNKRIYVYDGFYEKGMSNTAIADAIKSMLAHRHPTTADSSEPKSIDFIRGLGVNIRPAMKGPDSINAGIDFLLGYEIIVNAHLVEFMTEFNNYCWAVDKKDGKMLNKPIDEFNHFIDSLRYGMESMMRNTKAFVMKRSR